MVHPHPPVGRSRTRRMTACQMTLRPLMSGLRPKKSATQWRAKNTPRAPTPAIPANTPTRLRRLEGSTRRQMTSTPMAMAQPRADSMTVADPVRGNTARPARPHSTVDKVRERVCIHRSTRHTPMSRAMKASGLRLPGKPWIGPPSNSRPSIQ